MEPYQDRVIAEKAELDKKLSGLLAFFQTAEFKGLTDHERSLLTVQSIVMTQYSAILCARITCWE